MAFHYFIVCVFIISPFWTTCIAGKYSEDANLSWQVPESKNFRMKKVNALWDAVKKKVPDYRLKELYKELQVQDKLEADLKKARADHGDEDGLVEAKALANLRRIVDKFNLEQYMAQENVPPPSNEIPTDASDLERDTEIRDKKLNKLWNQAVKAGFSEEELVKLKEEFSHQQMKIDELSLLRDHLKDIEDTHENSLDQFEEGKDPARVKQKQEELKDLHGTVRDGYMRLEARASKAGRQLEFKDPRVLQLWVHAKKSNMTEKELVSFQEELRHFETRIQKHEFYQDQVEAAESQVKDMKAAKKHKDLKQKADNQALKVKMVHTELKEKIKKYYPHSEL